ncbi:precorrin-3B synthase [Streptomyces sp. XD-27]|uniref:precorrin-3B synthase n=1 Tax=Streptomyces sp. XD-27 TaxID=3062779 RepID=UPI0026F44E19|nr:precorrin-3B synthase [Streptomyces sp. XD-27]WKX74102.1 precorrin-3B synthase [Streptomyces sp. XD-27]
MLAAMPLTPKTSPTRGEPPPRGRGDACPGALRLHQADDGALARVRLPGGLLTPHQAEVLARAAEELGNGRLDLTSRGNIQLRGLGSDCGGPLADRLRGAGLLPSDRHERARNVVASPLAGLDGGGHADVQRWARRLDELLCTEPDTASLSGRFLFAVDDGRGDVAALDADVTLIARPGGGAVLHVGGSEDDGAPACRGLMVRAEDAPGAAVVAALEFLAAVRESGTRAWRARELPAPYAVSARRLAARLAAAGIAATALASPYAADAGDAEAARPAPGLVSGPDGRCALSVLAPLGRVTAGQWRLLTATAAREGAGELRVTPWRGVVLPGVSAGGGRELLAALADAGLVTDRNSPWYGVGACTGRPGCAKSLADVRADAERAARAAPAVSGAAAHALPVYWSGCERRCGHPGGRWVDVLATGDGYRVAARGTGAPETEHAVRVVTAEQAADAVAAARGTT